MHGVNPATQPPHASARAPACAVLLIEDDPGDAELIQVYLRQETQVTYEVQVQPRLDAGVALLASGGMDVVIVDLGLPDSVGLDAITTILAIDETIPIVVLTGWADDRAGMLAVRYGAQDYLVKGAVTADLLSRSLNYAIERKRLESQLRRRESDIRLAHEETIRYMVLASTYRDVETGGHIRRVGLFSRAMARNLGWNDLEQETIGLAAEMHDVGKLGIPDGILLKPGRLSSHEYDIMKQHTIIGGHILAAATSVMLTMAREIATYHHERWDGTGYPHGLSGRDIPLEARIVSICDVYDALSHDRVYRGAMSEPEVLEILSEGRGTAFDPELLDLFLDDLPVMRQICIDNPDQAHSGLDGLIKMSCEEACPV